MFRLPGNQRFKNINETASTQLHWILDYCVSVGPYLDGVKDRLQGGKNICEESDPRISQNGELLITLWTQSGRYHVTTSQTSLL